MPRGKKTRYPGVYHFAPRTYRITAKVKCGRKDRWIEETIEATSAAAAAAVRREKITERQQPQVTIETETFRTWTQSWLKRKAKEVEIKTLEGYANALKRARRNFGDVPIGDLRPAHIQKWIDLEQDDEFDYTADTLKGWHRVIANCLADAQVMHDLARNPATRIKLPKAEEEDPDKPNALQPHELMAFLSAYQIVAERDFPLVATLAFTGLRFSVASAIQWGDVNLEEGTITLARKQIRGVVGKITKRKRAPATLPIDKGLVALLEKLKAKAPALPSAWVFPARHGGVRPAPSTLQKSWPKAIDKANAILKEAKSKTRIEYLTPKGLRRTFNDLLRMADVDKEISMSMMGHHTDRMRSHYSHVRGPEMRAAIESVGRLVSGGKVGFGVGFGSENEKDPESAKTRSGSSEAV